MTTYGPWVQDADYQRLSIGSTAWSNVIQGRIANSYSGHGQHVETGFEYVPVPASWIVEAHAAALVNDGELPPTNSAARGTTQWGGSGAIGTPTWSSGAYVDINFKPWPLDPGDSYGAPWPWPEGAVGVEYENEQRSTAVDAWLSAETELVSIDTDYTTPSPTSVAGHSTTIAASARPPGYLWDDPSLFTTAGAAAGPRAPGDGTPTVTPLGEDIHLWPIVQQTGGFGWIWTVPPFVGAADAGEVRPANGNLWEWGALIYRPWVRWTYRPPRYRFIFDEDETVSYRRIFPRDDGLAGGAPRAFPPSRAIQSSNRIGGGYL